MLMNWLSISTVLDECRNLKVPTLESEISSFVSERKRVQLAQVYAQFEVPRKQAFAALMRAHQQRQLTVQIKTQPVTWSTLIVPWSAP
jgi:hypothetical protein